MIDVSAEAGWLSTTLQIQILLQMIIQVDYSNLYWIFYIAHNFYVSKGLLALSVICFEYSTSSTLHDVPLQEKQY